MVQLRSENTMQTVTNETFQRILEQADRDDLWKLLNWLQKVNFSISDYSDVQNHEAVSNLFVSELELTIEQLRLEFLTMLTTALQTKLISEIQRKHENFSERLVKLNGSIAKD